MVKQSTTKSDYRALYREAFERYDVQALWSFRRKENPSPGDALVIARELRLEGDMPARFLAEEIEAACRAAD